MKTLAASMLLCGSAAIGLWACAGDGVDRSHQIAETPTLSVRTVAATAVGETHGDDPLGWRAPGFRQRYTAINFNSVVVTDFAEGTGGAWFSVAHQSSATFYVMRVACGGLDRYAVLGLTRDERPVEIVRDEQGSSALPVLDHPWKLVRPRRGHVACARALGARLAVAAVERALLHAWTSVARHAGAGTAGTTGTAGTAAACKSCADADRRPTGGCRRHRVPRSKFGRLGGR